MTIAVTNAAKVIVIIDKCRCCCNYHYSRSSLTYQWQLQLSKLMQLHVSMTVAVAVINIAQQWHLSLRAAVTAVKVNAVARIDDSCSRSYSCQVDAVARMYDGCSCSYQYSSTVAIIIESSSYSGQS